jgi:hypothetical protein
MERAMRETIVAWRRRGDWPKWQKLQKTRDSYEDYLNWIGRFVDLRVWKQGNYPKMITVRPHSSFEVWKKVSGESIDQEMLDEYAASIARMVDEIAA